MAIRWTQRYVCGAYRRLLVDTTTGETLDADCTYKLMDDFIELPAELSASKLAIGNWAIGPRRQVGTATVTLGDNGTLVMSTIGHAASDAMEVIGAQTCWDVSSGLMLETRIKMPAVYGVSEPDMEFGFKNAANNDYVKGVILVGGGAGDSVARLTLHTDLAAAGDVAATGTCTLAAATYYIFRLEVPPLGTGSTLYVNGNLIATATTGAVTVGHLDYPFVYIGLTTAHIGIQAMTVDYVRVFAFDRATG